MSNKSLNVAWVYPVNIKCGISIYSKNYINSLQNKITIRSFNLPDILSDYKNTAKTLNNFDIVHIQYEVSLLGKNSKNKFEKLMRLIKTKKIVSLHEVYTNAPGTFPRSEISGSFKIIKKIIYDIKHPLNTILTRHENSYFFSDLILTHYNFQKDILTKKVPSYSNIIQVLPHPIRDQVTISTKNNDHIKICSSGFINRNFNYDLLFESLNKLNADWHFTWIGGSRNSDSNEIFLNIKTKIAELNWEDKFVITNWVSTEEQKSLIQHSDVYLALFKNRSSSGSIMNAILNQVPIISSDLPLTREISGSDKMLIICKENPTAISEQIISIYSNNDDRERIKTLEKKYSEQNSYSNLSNSLINIYKELLQ